MVVRTLLAMLKNTENKVAVIGSSSRAWDSAGKDISAHFTALTFDSSSTARLQPLTPQYRQQLVEALSSLRPQGGSDHRYVPRLSWFGKSFNTDLLTNKQSGYSCDSGASSSGAISEFLKKNDVTTKTFDCSVSLWWSCNMAQADTSDPAHTSPVTGWWPRKNRLTDNSASLQFIWLQ